MNMSPRRSSARAVAIARTDAERGARLRLVNALTLMALLLVALIAAPLLAIF